MRLGNNAKISHQDTERQVGHESYAPFVKHSHSVLTLPRFGKSVETEFSSGLYSKNMALLALNLLRAGYIKESATDDLKTLVQGGIQQWISESARGIEMFNFNVEIRPEINCMENLLYDDDLNVAVKEMSKVAGKSPMYFLIEPNIIQSFTIGRILLEIENKVPGLGKTAYGWLAETGHKVFRVYTPWTGEEYAYQAWWYGEDNQEDFLSVAREYHDEVDDLSELDLIGPDDWRSAFPEWVTAINKPLDETALKEIEKVNPDSLESKVAHAVLEIIKLQEAKIPDVALSLMPVYNSIYLHWEEGDMSSRLVDDYLNSASEAGEGYTETMTLCPIPNKPKELKVWMEGISQGLLQLKNIERLIKLIGNPN